jgi:PAS domain S-box-containing protein
MASNLVDKPSPVHILHVDDDPAQLITSKQILSVEAPNFEVDCATSTDEALKKIQTNTYDVIISDFEMPYKDGLFFLSELRRQQNNTPFILFTGKGREEVAIKALNFGADGYVNKHGNPEIVYNELLHCLKNAIDHKTLQEDILTHEVFLSSLFSNITEVLFSLSVEPDGELVFTSANDSFLKTTGFQESQVIGKRVQQVIPEPSLTLVLEKYAQAIREKRVVSWEEITVYPAGRKWGEVTVSPIFNKQGRCIALIGNVHDITERKNAEEKLKQAQQDWELTFNTVPDLITILDKEHRIIRVNDSLTKRLGLKCEEIIGKKCYEVIHGLSQPPSWCPHSLTVVDEKEHIVEMTEPRLGGQFAVSTSLIKNTNGSISAVHVARDITQLKKAEERLEVVNGKLRVVGKLTRHDVGNKLMIIVYTTYLLKKRYGKDPEIANYLSNIDSAAAMANRIFDFSRYYEKIGAEEQATIKIKSCFEEAVELFSNLGKIEVINETEGLTVVADSLLQQLFYNLIDNTLKHGKTVTKIKLHYQRDANQVKLYYEDDGVGVPEENKVNIFSEGFTTGDGAGLGLSMIKKMMDVYNWSIQENGLPGNGIRFEIIIPLTVVKLEQQLT